MKCHFQNLNWNTSSVLSFSFCLCMCHVLISCLPFLLHYVHFLYISLSPLSLHAPPFCCFSEFSQGSDNAWCHSMGRLEAFSLWHHFQRKICQEAVIWIKFYKFTSITNWHKMCHWRFKFSGMLHCVTVYSYTTGYNLILYAFCAIDIHK